MQYHAKLPEGNSNVSHQQPVKEFLSLLFGVLAFVLFVYWVMGFFIDAAIDRISPEMEVAIFASLNGVTGPEKPDNASEQFKQTEQAMRALLTELSACANLAYPVTLSFEQSTQANAYAAPGGKMVVFSGLLDYVISENGLAFVIAHELGHFKHRDHLRGMGRGIVLMAISVLATGNAQLSKLLLPWNQFQAAQFSQQREKDADATALDIIQCHYGHVSGAPEFFNRISRVKNELPLTHYFDSHPEAKSRVKAIKAMSQKKHYIEGNVKAAFWPKRKKTVK